MAPWPVFVLAGIAIGFLTGLFGVGGSSVATPLLSLLGVPGFFAVASPRVKGFTAWSLGNLLKA